MSSAADSLLLSIKCKKPGHESNPIIKVCNLGGCKDRLACTTCFTGSHSHHSNNLDNIKAFLQNYVVLEEQKEDIMRENMQLQKTQASEDNLKEMKDELDNDIEDFFHDMMKLTKILYENAQEKFRQSNQDFHNSIKTALDDTKTYQAQKELSVKQQIQNCDGKVYDQVQQLCDNLLRNDALNSLDQLSVKQKFLKPPKIDTDKCKKVKEEILEFVKDKLKKLLQEHSIKSTDLTWHSRSADQLCIYYGHSDHVTDLTVMPDGTLVSCSKDRTMRFWDTDMHLQKQLENLHDKNLNAVCAMPNGNVAIAKDNIIKFYNPAKAEFERALTGHVKTIFTLAAHPDGTLFSAGQDNVIKSWNVSTGIMIRAYHGHDDFIRKILISKDGKQIISASDDKSVKIWDIQSGEVINSLDAHSDYVYSISLMNNGNVVCGSRDGQVKVWNVEKSECLLNFKAHDNWIYSTCCLADNTIATGSADYSIKLWNPKTGELVKTLIGHKFPVRGLQVLSDGNLASCSEDNSIIIWASKKLEVLYSFSSHSKAVWCIIELDDRKFASGSEDRTIKIWDAQEGRLVKTITGHKDQVRALLKINSALFASGSSDKQIIVWDSSTGNQVAVMNGHDGAVRSLSLTFDSKLISGAEDKLIKVWDLANYQCVNTLKGHDDYLRVVKGLKNGRIASGARDNTLKVWNVQTNTCEISLKGHSLPIWSILEIQIDKILATGSADFTIKIWDMQVFRAINTLSGHSGPVWCMLQLNETLILSGSEDCQIKIWDWEYGDCVRTLLSHSYAVWGLACSDDEYVASGSWQYLDKTVKIWNVKKKIVGKSTQALKNDDDARSKFGNRSQMQSRMSKASKVESSTVEVNKLNVQQPPPDQQEL